MEEVKISPTDKADLVQKLKKYFDKELQQDIGQFDAEFLLDFFGKEMGKYFYNQGLYDAQTLIQKSTDELEQCILDLEQPTY